MTGAQPTPGPFHVCSMNVQFVRAVDGYPPELTDKAHLLDCAMFKGMTDTETVAMNLIEAYHSKAGIKSVMKQSLDVTSENAAQTRRNAPYMGPTKGAKHNAEASEIEAAVLKLRGEDS